MPALSPFARLRRLRSSAPLREALAETRLHAAQLIQPHFVVESRDARTPIGALPGIDRVGLDALLRDVERDLALGIASVLLFGVIDDPALKDPHGRRAADPDGLVPRAVRELRRRFGAALVIHTDVCLCAYTSHGHCGFVEEGRVLNDASLAALAAMALAHARAGADFVAPSDMLDGRIAALRAALDEAGCTTTGILSYAAKFASGYYGPFREAASSAPQFGDRRTYQMDLRNGREALRELAADEAEGADLLMVKPALAYLDVLARARAATRLPLVAYNVSGEYAQVKAAAERGWIDEGAVVRENLLAFARAGADLVITYHAREALQKGWLR
ncbi:MAG: porphobilinogen synthase [Planctomycetes bacterium]|nr:porphobilinogen synthase [Planctomycetota bacterium]